MDERSYYTIDPEGKLQCLKCGVPLEKGKAKFLYLDNGFPVELPVCPKCGFVYDRRFLPVGLPHAHRARGRDAGPGNARCRQTG